MPGCLVWRRGGANVGRFFVTRASCPCGPRGRTNSHEHRPLSRPGWPCHGCPGRTSNGPLPFVLFSRWHGRSARVVKNFSGRARRPGPRLIFTPPALPATHHTPTPTDAAVLPPPGKFAWDGRGAATLCGLAVFLGVTLACAGPSWGMADLPPADRRRVCLPLDSGGFRHRVALLGADRAAPVGGGVDDRRFSVRVRRTLSVRRVPLLRPRSFSPLSPPRPWGGAPMSLTVLGLGLAGWLDRATAFARGRARLGVAGLAPVASAGGAQYVL